MGLLDQMRARSLEQRGIAWVKADGRHAWFTAPDTVGLEGWYLMYQAPGGLNASMRPSHDPAKAKAGLAFRSEPLEYDRRDLDEQRELLADRFLGAGWHCDALITAAREADDFYVDAFLQIHMDSWSSGRVALVGDAGYCASPLSGMGTSLALVGAYVLAGELGPAGVAAGIDACSAGRFALSPSGNGSPPPTRSTCPTIRVCPQPASTRLPYAASAAGCAVMAPT